MVTDDGLLTYFGTKALGLEYEGNPLITYIIRGGWLDFYVLYWVMVFAFNYLLINIHFYFIEGMKKLIPKILMPISLSIF